MAVPAHRDRRRTGMLFNDPVFLFLFLPAALAGFFLLGGTGRRTWALAWLVVASIFFYGYWNPLYTLLLLGSIAVNGILGWVLATDSEERRRQWLLGLGIAANLCLIGYFKYLGFFTEVLNQVGGQDFPILKLVLPLGISFFTFEQITYLVEAYRRTTKAYGALEFLLFVTFFPRLIAGPIVRPAEIIPQFSRLSLRPDHRDLVVGVTIFLVGLLEKVLVADTIAPVANGLFDRADAGHVLTFAEAWLAALAYTVQLYFDFCGYSNMALGLARLFGIRLPLNFNSPYRATSIIDFWRRWHISLSRFLRDYLYIPLGGSRKGEPRRYLNLFLTMVIGGLWHGAGMTFVLWGALHGGALALNHLWRSIGPRSLLERPRWWTTAVSGVLTFGCVVVGWVLFRAPNSGTGGSILASMAGLNGIGVAERLQPLTRLAPFLPWKTDGFGPQFEPWGLFFALAALTWAIKAPNVQEWMASAGPALEEVPARGKDGWKPSFGVAFVLGLGLFAILNTVLRASASQFLYFNF